MNSVHDWMRPAEQDPRMFAKFKRYCSASQKGELRVLDKVDCRPEHVLRLGLWLSGLDLRSSSAISSSRQPFGIIEARQKRIVDSNPQRGGPYRPVFLSTADFPTCASIQARAAAPIFFFSSGTGIIKHLHSQDLGRKRQPEMSITSVNSQVNEIHCLRSFLLFYAVWLQNYYQVAFCEIPTRNEEENLARIPRHWPWREAGTPFHTLRLRPEQRRQRECCLWKLQTWAASERVLKTWRLIRTYFPHPRPQGCIWISCRLKNHLVSLHSCIWSLPVDESSSIMSSERISSSPNLVLSSKLTSSMILATISGPFFSVFTDTLYSRSKYRLHGQPSRMICKW